MILLAVGWYLRFSLSYREVEELLAERCLLVDHVTVWRWVQRYTPELQRRLRRHLNSKLRLLRRQITMFIHKERYRPTLAAGALPHA